MRSACDKVIISGGWAKVRASSKLYRNCTTIMNCNSVQSMSSVSNSSVVYKSFANGKQKQLSFARTSTGQYSLGNFIAPSPINSRVVTRKFSNIPSSSLSRNEKGTGDDLRRNTTAWLELPVGTWTQREVSRGRFLIREWSESSTVTDNLEKAVAQTRIIRRWMKEYRAAALDNENLQLRSLFRSQRDEKGSNSDSKEMVEMLNRCLDSWRTAATISSSPKGTTSRNKGFPQEESMKLIHLFCDASESLNDRDLRPNQKTYSMCMNVLSLYPESPTVCDDVLTLLNQCRKNTETDLQFYGVCLHTLAKCATHHPEAPTLVEGIFREMTTLSNLSPSTACFVSVLHAWANSIPSGDAKPHRYRSEKDAKSNSLAAERAEAILDQMIRNYPQLLDTICFNICIDAWGRQGHPEKAEAILRRLHQYQPDNGSKTKVRPNQISFNSAINAWSKSASVGGKGVHDPQKAANRASRLFQQMKAQGLEPSSETFGSLMEVYSKIPNSGVKVQNFLDELERMHSEGKISHPPPKVCYLMAIQAWGRTKDGGAKQAESLVQRLEQIACQEGCEWVELKPCTIVYTALISAWAQSEMDFAPDRARDLFREMWQKSNSGERNLSPNTITLNTVLEAFCNHGRIEEACDFLTNTKRAVSSDSKSYLTILKAYANSNSEDSAEKAQKFLRKLEDDYRRGERATKPTIRMYSQILVAWGNSSRSDAAFRAEEFFWKLLQQDDESIGVTPDTTTFNCVLRAWSKSREGGAAERAEAFLRKVRDDHSDIISIDPISHLHLIYAWAHSRRKKAPKEAEKHLEQARALCGSSKESGWSLTRAHFNGTILAWKKSNDSNAALRIQQLQEERDSTTGI